MTPACKGARDRTVHEPAGLGDGSEVEMRRPSCPRPSPSVAPRFSAQERLRRVSTTMHRLKDVFELDVWEKGSIFRAPSDLMGTGPSNHMDEGWSWGWVTMERHRWYLGSVLNRSQMTHRWRAVL